MKHVITIFLIATISIQLMAQVGIGTTNPNSKSALDVYSKKKGLLIPRITDVGGADKTEGSLIYDSINAAFLYCHDDNWYDLSSLVAENNGNIAELKSKYDTLKASTFAGHGTIPVGGIIMWSGNEADLPDGWALCDGDKVEGMQTPDLRGRFIVGSGTNGNGVTPGVWDNSYSNAGDLSEGRNKTNKGAFSHTYTFTLTANQLPKHWHTGNSYGNNDGMHNHIYRDSYMIENTGDWGGYQNWKKDNEQKILGFSENTYTRYVGSNGGMDTDNNTFLTMYRVTGSLGKFDQYGNPSNSNFKYDNLSGGHYNNYHRHNILTNKTVTTHNASGTETANAVIDKRPPYYALAFIMRVK